MFSNCTSGTILSPLANYKSLRSCIDPTATRHADPQHSSSIITHVPVVPVARGTGSGCRCLRRAVAARGGARSPTATEWRCGRDLVGVAGVQRGLRLYIVERLRHAVELGHQRRPSGGAAVTWSTSHGMSVFCDFMAVECLLKLSCVGRLTV